MLQVTSELNMIVIVNEPVVIIQQCHIVYNGRILHDKEGSIKKFNSERKPLQYSCYSNHYIQT
jgi:hypothetical protein